MQRPVFTLHLNVVISVILKSPTGSIYPLDDTKQLLLISGEKSGQELCQHWKDILSPIKRNEMQMENMSSFGIGKTVKVLQK